jgi:hypothetical protein
MVRSWQAWRPAAVLLTVLVPACADAAWLGYKNDTQAVIVVQSASMVNNQVRLGKAHILYPGEIAWDAVTAPGLRQISVFDPKQPPRPLHRDIINSQNIDFLSVQMVTPPAVRGQAQTAQIKFVPSKPPVMPGVNVPGTKPNQPSPGNPKGQPPGTGVPLPPNPPKAGPPVSSPPPKPGTPANPAPPGPPPSTKGKS